MLGRCPLAHAAPAMRDLNEFDDRACTIWDIRLSEIEPQFLGAPFEQFRLQPTGSTHHETSMTPNKHV